MNNDYKELVTSRESMHQNGRIIKRVKLPNPMKRPYKVIELLERAAIGYQYKVLGFQRDLFELYMVYEEVPENVWIGE